MITEPVRRDVFNQTAGYAKDVHELLIAGDICHFTPEQQKVVTSIVRSTVDFALESADIALRERRNSIKFKNIPVTDDMPIDDVIEAALQQIRNNWTWGLSVTDYHTLRGMMREVAGRSAKEALKNAIGL